MRLLVALIKCVFVVSLQASNKFPANSPWPKLERRNLQLRIPIFMSEIIRPEIPKPTSLRIRNKIRIDCELAKTLERHYTALSYKTRITSYWENYCIFTAYKFGSYSTKGKFLAPQTRQSNNHIFKASVVEFPPYVTRSSTEEFGGYCLSIMDTLADTLRINYTIVEPVEKAPGGPVNGTWDGIVGMLMNGEADIGLGAFTITYARAQVIDFTYPIFEESTAILIPPAQEESNLLACFRPFQASVWISILAVMTISSFVLWLFLYYAWKHNFRTTFPSSAKDLIDPTRPKPTFGMQVLFVLGAIITQAGTCTANTHSSRVLAGAWCLTALVFVYGYNSTLVAFLTIPREKALVNNIDDVAEGNALTLTVMKSTSFDLLMLSATAGAYKAIGDSLRQYPDRRVANSGEGVRKVLTGQHAYIMDKTVIDEIIYNDWKNNAQRNGANTKCRLTEAKEPFYKSSVALMISKTNPHTAAINAKMLAMHEAGMMHYWGRRSFPPPNPCLDFSSRVHPRSRALTFIELQSAFLTFALGWLAAVVVFVYEVQKAPLLTFH